MNVPHARTEVAGIAHPGPVLDHVHPRTRGLDLGDVGVHLEDGLDHIAELGVAHVAMHLGLVPHDRRRHAEGLDGPGQVLGPLAAPQGKALTKRRFVDLDDLDPLVLEIGHLVADGQGQLQTCVAPILVVAHE